MIRELEIVREGTTLHVIVPARPRDLLARDGAAKAFEREIADFAADIGTVLVPPSNLASGSDKRRQDSCGRTQPGSSDIVGGDSASARVVIVTFGQRARQLLRHLGAPDWTPDWNDDEKYDSLAKVAIDVVDEHLATERIEQYSVIIWVTDEESLEYFSQTFPPELMRRVSSGELLCILAPMLPAQAPPALLARSLPATRSAVHDHS